MDLNIYPTLPGFIVPLLYIWGFSWFLFCIGLVKCTGFLSLSSSWAYLKLLESFFIFFSPSCLYSIWHLESLLLTVTQNMIMFFLQITYARIECKGEVGTNAKNKCSDFIDWKKNHGYILLLKTALLRQEVLLLIYKQKRLYVVTVMLQSESHFIK